MARRVRSIWERLTMESTEGPTVTISLPRELAQQLVGSLMGSLELDGDMGDGMADDGMGLEPDADDIGGVPDGDADDVLAAFAGGDAGAEDDDDPDPIPAGDDDDDADDDSDEGYGPTPKTALGERRRRR